MSWKAQLKLHYTHRDGRTTALDRHEGPLRVLQRLYPEGPGICHHVIVHPPGGVVGGDRLEVEAQLDSGTHALLTTPGAVQPLTLALQTPLHLLREFRRDPAPAGVGLFQSGEHRMTQLLRVAAELQPLTRHPGGRPCVTPYRVVTRVVGPTDLPHATTTADAGNANAPSRADGAFEEIARAGNKPNPGVESVHSRAPFRAPVRGDVRA